MVVKVVERGDGESVHAGLHDLARDALRHLEYFVDRLLLEERFLAPGDRQPELDHLRRLFQIKWIDGGDGRRP
jgi:hypothetical protein